MKALLRSIVVLALICPQFSDAQDQGFTATAVAAAVVDVNQVCAVSRPNETAAEKLLLLASDDVVFHGGGLNACGCHFNRKTGECHCHRPKSCGCACQPATCR